MNLEAYKSATTEQDRFRIDVGNFVVAIDEILVYLPGGSVRLTDCSPGVTIDTGATGAIFDGACSPADVLTAPNSYTAILKGTIDGGAFRSTFDFDYIATPGP